VQTSTKKYKLYFIAGEASGDLHGGNLIKALKQENLDFISRGFGGEKMQSQGMHCVKHFKEASFMGFVEVIKNLNTIRQLFTLAKEDIKAFQPDAVILIDFPGFNLRLLPFLKTLSTKIIWYIAPQAWAWKANRSKILKRYVDLLLVILPFEKAFFRKYTIDPKFVGHPLLDEIENKHKVNDASKTIALLPGSRKQEITKMLPTMLKMKKHFPSYKFKIAALSVHGKEFYQSFTKNSAVEICFDQTYSLLKESYAALVTSGTATLETALHKIPQIVCYKGSLINYLIGKQLVKVKYISLVNLILDKESICELIQNDFNENKLKQELNNILSTEKRKAIARHYAELINLLGKSGASKKSAQAIISSLQNKKNTLNQI